jgi:predicted DNA-binding transcriptional regulator AlpA
MTSNDGRDAEAGLGPANKDEASDNVLGNRLIRLRDLFAMLDVSKPTGHRLLAAGKVGPRAIRLTSACVRFDAEEVATWLKARKPDGSLYDAKGWPPIWEMIQKKNRT